MTEPVKWNDINYRIPVDGRIVMTKIDDEKGVRNVQKLMFKNNKFWSAPDYTSYVYYTPTHWYNLTQGD
jgi:hypothetical protein